MSNIDKQALHSTSDRDWFEEWFKSEFHPDKTGPYIKDQLFFAVRAARAPLRDELEAADSGVAELNGALCKLLPGCQYMDPPDGGSVTPLEQVTRMVADYRDRMEATEKRVAELEASHSKLRESMAAIHNTIRRDGAHTSLAVILNAAKRAHDESAAATGIRINGED